MSTHHPTSIESSRDRLGHAWEALSDARDWNVFAFAYQALMREYLAASIAIWQDGVARFAQSQGELGAALSGACHNCMSVWETPWWIRVAPPVPGEGVRRTADAASKPKAEADAAHAH